MTTRADVIAEARTWAGTPFHHQARLKGVGCDCIGLVLGVGRALGLLPPGLDATGYARQPDGSSLRDGFDRYGVPLAIEQVRPGDILLMRIRRDPQHVGILLPGGAIIHAHSAVGRVVEVPLDERWMERVLGAYAYPGLEG